MAGLLLLRAHHAHATITAVPATTLANLPRKETIGVGG